jgi:hypothetical protein
MVTLTHTTARTRKARTRSRRRTYARTTTYPRTDAKPHHQHDKVLVPQQLLPLREHHEESRGWRRAAQAAVLLALAVCAQDVSHRCGAARWRRRPAVRVSATPQHSYIGGDIMVVVATETAVAAAGHHHHTTTTKGKISSRQLQHTHPSLKNAVANAATAADMMPCISSEPGMSPGAFTMMGGTTEPAAFPRGFNSDAIVVASSRSLTGNLLRPPRALQRSNATQQAVIQVPPRAPPPSAPTAAPKVDKRSTQHPP